MCVAVCCKPVGPVETAALIMWEPKERDLTDLHTQAQMHHSFIEYLSYQMRRDAEGDIRYTVVLLFLKLRSLLLKTTATTTAPTSNTTE